MTPRFPTLTLIGYLLASLTLMNCRPAVYEIVKPKKDPSGPQNLGPTESTEQAAPTAAIEVIRNGVSVTKVRVNEPTTIQPTADTVDPDDVGKSSCPNPGIIQAQYKIASEASPEVNRGSNCDTLAVPYTFANPGDYLITLTVKSAEGETSIASMTLHVIQANAPADDDGGFLIKANPMIIGIGQEISFSGFCTTSKANQISWVFADGGTGDGATIKHSYAKVGAYHVEATCRETASAGRSWTASVTVVVMEKPVTPPASTTPPGYNTPSGPTPGGDVGQNTGSDRPGQTPITLPWNHTQPTQPTPGAPGPVTTPSRNCGVFIFQWSC